MAARAAPGPALGEENGAPDHMQLPPELWYEVRQHLGVSDILATARLPGVAAVCQRCLRGALAPRPARVDVDVQQVAARAGPAPVLPHLRDAARLTSWWSCNCLRRAAGAVTLIRFIGDCCDFQRFRPNAPSS